MALCIGVFEVILRITDYVPRDLGLYRPNPAGGGSFRLKPGLDVVTRFGALPVSIKTNAHGMRWRDTPLRSGGAKQRVAFVGDSFTFGLWADSAEHTLVGVTDAALAHEGFEVMNFGVPGYGFLDAELLIQQEVLAFDPDHVVLVFYTGNDFLDTHLGLHRYRVAGNGTLELDGQVTRERIPGEFRDDAPMVREFFQDVRVYTLLRHAVNGLRRDDQVRRGPVSMPAANGYTSNIFWSQARYPAFGEAAKTASLSAMRRIKARCDQQGVQLLVVSVPGIEQIYHPEWFVGDYDIRFPQQHVEDVARAEGVAYLDLLPALAHEARANRANLHFQRDGHFNNAGHRVGGEHVAAFLRQHATR